jgi:hypothetical protein
LTAQSPASVRHAVSSITAADVVRRIGILADDSMLGRATPSPQLDKVAAYIAAEFRRFGLKPGGDNGSYEQRYPLTSVTLVPESSYFRLTGAVRAEWRLGQDASLYRGQARAGGRESSAEMVVVSGTPADRLADPTQLNGKVLLYLGFGRGTLQQVIAKAQPAAIVFATTLPEPEWQERTARQSRPAIQFAAPEASSAPIFLVRLDRVLAALRGTGVGADTSAVTRNGRLRIRPVPGVVVHFVLRQLVNTGLSAPNVIGILEGSDPRLKHEYVFFTGHMDHLGTPGSGEGCVARGADSICNGADDDASGTTAVLAAAAAFSRLSPRPKRSLVFMTVSGEERGLWGSSYYTDHPTVPLADVVADLNTDMVGRNWRDTIAVIGKEHSDLGATLNRVGAAHPELHMQPIDDIWPQEGFYFRSDHYNFARKGVPILFFFNGTHPDYHQVTDEVAKIDGEKESRIVKLVFYLGLEIANAAGRPKWNPESFRRIVQGQD